MISSSVPANTEKYIRSWFARIVAVDVRSREQIQLLLLDPVLHLAAGAVQFLVQLPARHFLPAQAGDHVLFFQFVFSGFYQIIP